jgi:putative CocE/NonD family hydrolase
MKSAAAAILLFAQVALAQSETPQTFTPVTDRFDYVRREVMIPMRDGVKLKTVIVIPKGAKNAPILLTRTPYDVAKRAEPKSAHIGTILTGWPDVVIEAGYIRVEQDIRGKHGSEGEYVMNRPLRGPLNPTQVDHSTDTYDTIDWLVKNIPESNGRVGIIGISYDGFLPLMALVNPHPALKAAVPVNPMVDGWIGDDWFHNGAFRQTMLPYIYDQEATRGSDEKWWTTDFDVYDTYLDLVSAGAVAKSRGLEQVGFWRKIAEHPNYDAFWREQAMDRILAAQPLTVPTMLVHSLWDQEDIYGAIAVYKALEPKDVRNDKLYLVMGPWSHGQANRDGSSLGALKFGSDTSLWFRANVLRPFLDRYLRDQPADIAPVTAFETGTNRWERLQSWPGGKSAKFYLKSGFAAPKSDGFDEYVSDPAKPVPYINRPVFADGRAWRPWLVSDQRESSGRPDVLTFVSEPLKEAVKISGQPVANLVASTTGTDADWVVKLIDVYPSEVMREQEMGGYQLMVSADIFRGRFRESFETPKPIAANQPLPYRFALPAAHHVFLPGHRIMVQVQSTWFPLYDRNPQAFVPNILFAQPADYRKATQRIYHSSFIELPLL